MDIESPNTEGQLHSLGFSMYNTGALSGTRSIVQWEGREECECVPPVWRKILKIIKNIGGGIFPVSVEAGIFGAFTEKLKYLSITFQHDLK